MCLWSSDLYPVSAASAFTASLLVAIKSPVEFTATVPSFPSVAATESEHF
jgi:hypothetical protein